MEITAIVVLKPGKDRALASLVKIVAASEESANLVLYCCINCCKSSSRGLIIKLLVYRLFY